MSLAQSEQRRVGRIWSDVDWDNEDLHLSARSPAIGVGDPSTTDADGSTADLGAYGGSYGNF